MMKTKQSELILGLKEMTQEARRQTEIFRAYPMEKLNYKPNSETWSILECLDHLCRYGKFYLPEIEARINKAKKESTEFFKAGILGNYFVNMIRVDNVKKMSSPKEMDSTGSELNASTIDQFLKQLDWLEKLLNRAEEYNLTRLKTSISLSPWVKLRLGDTLRFVVYHNERHIIQAQRMANN